MDLGGFGGGHSKHDNGNSLFPYPKQFCLGDLAAEGIHPTFAGRRSASGQREVETLLDNVPKMWVSWKGNRKDKCEIGI